PGRVEGEPAADRELVARSRSDVEAVHEPGAAGARAQLGDATHVVLLEPEVVRPEELPVEVVEPRQDRAVRDLLDPLGLERESEPGAAGRGVDRGHGSLLQCWDMWT